MKRILVFFVAFIALVPVFSKDSDNAFKKGQPFFQVQYHRGLHWNRSIYMDPENYKNYQSFDARFGFQTTGGKAWHQLNRYPRYGLGLHYADEVPGRKDSVLSNPLSMYVFYEAPLVRIGEHLRIYGNYSVGLAYIEKIYDPVTNPYNDLVASHVNLFFNLNLNLGLQLNERLDMNLGYGFAHYSNGNIEEPQKGLNNWGWNMGMSCFFGDGERPFRRREFVTQELEKFKKFEELQFMLSVGYAERQGTNEPTGVYFWASSFTVDYAVHLTRRSGFTTGMDFFYDESIQYIMTGIAPEEVTSLQKFYFGGHIGYQHSIDRFTLLINLGTYFHQQTYVNEFFFARAGGRYRISDHLAAQITIKSRNGIRSHWIEWGLAYNVKVR